jgi:hypothetical protein
MHPWEMSEYVEGIHRTIMDAVKFRCDEYTVGTRIVDCRDHYWYKQHPFDSSYVIVAVWVRDGDGKVSRLVGSKHINFSFGVSNECWPFYCGLYISDHIMNSVSPKDYVVVNLDNPEFVDEAIGVIKSWVSALVKQTAPLSVTG